MKKHTIFSLYCAFAQCLLFGASSTVSERGPLSGDREGAHFAVSPKSDGASLDYLRPVITIPEEEQERVTATIPLDNESSANYSCEGFLWKGVLFGSDFRLLFPDKFKIVSASRDSYIHKISIDEFKDVLACLYGVTPDDVFCSCNSCWFIEKGGRVYTIDDFGPDGYHALKRASLMDFKSEDSARKYSVNEVKRLFGDLFKDVSIVDSGGFFSVEGVATCDFEVKDDSLNQLMMLLNPPGFLGPLWLQTFKLERGKTYKLSSPLVNGEH